MGIVFRSIIMVLILLLCNNISDYDITTWANLIVAIAGLTMTFIGLKVSCEGLRQTRKAREDIAYSQVKIKQAEVMSKLLCHLNRKTFFFCVVDNIDEASSLNYYECNIFELGSLISTKGELPQDMPVLFQKFKYSLLYVDDLLTDGFVDKDVADALALFDPKTSRYKLETNPEEVSPMLLIYSEEESQIGPSSTGVELFAIQNDNINTVASLKDSIKTLENTIKNWYKRNGIHDCNIQNNPNNIKPLKL